MVLINSRNSEEVILVEGRADVLNLLKNGFKNCIAMNGTSVPDSVKELCRQKEVIVFVDGDRGGDVIIRELLESTEIDFITKEVLKTEMRIRTKNKLFEKLSICGDRIFPGRKELIKQISNEFLGDIENFIQNYFQKEEPQGPPLYALREEIKALQAFAKSLTLNTHSFSETRMKLSECWDKLKDRERERKKEMAVKKQAFRQNYDAALEKIKTIFKVY